MTDDSPYIAVYLPGGHGAMLGLPDNPDLGELLRWAHRSNRFTLAICHGPAALLAAADQGPDLIDFCSLGYFVWSFRAISSNFKLST